MPSATVKTVETAYTYYLIYRFHEEDDWKLYDQEYDGWVEAKDDVDEVVDKFYEKHPNTEVKVLREM